MSHPAIKRRYTPQGTPLEERFNRYIEPDLNGGCMLWSGAISSGYGSICVERKKFFTHRLSWEMKNGPIPAGMHVLHRCDVRACVNPKHLFLGTNADNVADMIAKGRGAKGESNGHAKLTAAKVLVISAMIDAGKSGNAIARATGVTHQTVSNIKLGRSWASVTGRDKTFRKDKAS